MMKYLVLSLMIVSLSACTLMPEKPRPYTPVSGESQIPTGAMIQPGYQYPSVPLDQYQATASGKTSSGLAH